MMEYTLIKCVFGLLGILFFLLVLRVVALIMPENDNIEEAADIFAEKYNLQRSAIKALDSKDQSAYERAVNARSVLDQCVELVRPDANDDSSRWKPGGLEKWRKHQYENS
jgi:hypothetical protein